ncbi:oligopeptide ABC transporter substrate-binding protein [Paenibacillus sp. MMS20-IR301]|uniref:oligopeptide ABC transporter substrate-binding protein n=1 Tax=Paenibacillus sp. MMS20-IR301 TaxID=2895946 RepID=UPI0028E1BC57|nr:oligopeptide ABC transporter substrate-binding protein [Paenibacillus sp. MMS20-IR301]WNS42252.1 ABC transporter substrate-binding protein [Paenibacillus sp. MMS20-IR301]
MSKPLIGRLMLPLMLAVVLSACSASSTGSPPYIARLSKTADEPVAGGTVTYGYSSAFQGIFEPAFFEGEDDANVLEFTTEAMFTINDDLSTAPNIASWQESDDHTVFTFSIKPGVRWHNGDELTVEDWKFALETIASPDYPGSRYYSVEMIKGAEAYHLGQASEISGLKVMDPYTLRITMNSARVNLLDSLWAYPMNKRYFEGVAVKDMLDSDQVRQQPIGTGPFVVTSITPGQTVEMKRFNNYYKGEALLDGITYKVIEGKDTAALLEAGSIDIAAVPRDAYQTANQLDQVDIRNSPGLVYEYIGFKFGRWDEESGQVVMDNPKFQDKRLRKAMYYALDRQGIIDKYSYGLGTLIETPIPSSSWAKISDEEIDTYPYLPEKAKSLLDEAGYLDTDGDGFREDPDGKPFTVNYDAMSGSKTAEARTSAILQNWRDVGLNVQLNGGSLKELNSFYEAVESDDPSVELFNGVWGLASDPDPSGLWRATDAWNYPRWTSERSEELIRDGVSLKAYDKDFRKEIYYEWQKLINDEVPMIFFSERSNITAVNKRVQGVTVNALSNILDPQNWWIKEPE